jgi:hypothetical protein
MKKTSFSVLAVIAVLITSFIFIIGAHMIGDNPKDASAILTRDEAELCLELNTYLYPHPQEGYVDHLGYLNCLMYLDQD